MLQNIFRCVDEAEYITDGSVPVPTSIGKVEQLGPSVSSAKTVKLPIPQQVVSDFWLPNENFDQNLPRFLLLSNFQSEHEFVLEN